MTNLAVELSLIRSRIRPSRLLLSVWPNALGMMECRSDRTPSAPDVLIVLRSSVAAFVYGLAVRMIGMGVSSDLHRSTQRSRRAGGDRRRAVAEDVGDEHDVR